MRIARRAGPAGPVLLLATLTLLLAAPRAARACGGLFCSSANPVNQAAERIIFSFDRAKQEVTAVVEILYQGPADKFAWVLPVPGTPTVGVSTSAVLDRLQMLTNPTFAVQRTWANSCGPENARPAADAGSPLSPQPPINGGGKPDVAVLASGAVGPYLWELITVNPMLSDPGMAAIDWLKANGYEVGDLGPGILRSYLREGGLNLIAFKLQKDKTAGSIRPVMLTYKSDRPMIPIRPTAVAANPDMGILVFVLSSARAVPINYRTLELNETLINWFNPGPTYNQVVTAAADEAGGQGFVTELARGTDNGAFARGLASESLIIENFRRTADALSDANLIRDTLRNFASFAVGNFGGPFASRPSGMRVTLDGVADVVATTLKLPAGVTAEDVIAAPECYLPAFRTPGQFYCEGRVAPPETIDMTTFVRKDFVTAVEKLVIQPIENTVKLFVEQPYLTRLYTTLSAAEMTLDPEFDLNDEIGDVSNLHQVTLRYTRGCSGDTSGPWEAEIGDLVVRGEGNSWPIDLRQQRMPFNVRVTQLSTRGQPEVVTNNTGAIARALGGAQPRAGIVPPDPDAGSCAVGRGSGGVAGLALGLCAWLVLRARRRRHGV